MAKTQQSRDWPARNFKILIWEINIKESARENVAARWTVEPVEPNRATFVDEAATLKSGLRNGQVRPSRNADGDWGVISLALNCELLI